IAVVTGLENALAAHRGDPETIAIVGNARDHARENAAVARPGGGVVQPAESQRIHHRDGPRAHGENVAQNPANARRRALKRLDKAGMVVGFDLERNHVAAADIDDPRVLAGPLYHQFAARRQLLQVQAGALVRAVLAPHHRKYAQLGVARFAAEDIDDLAVFLRRQLMLGHQLGSHDGGTHARTAASSIDRKTTRPSDEPISGSVARSGCGIMPITLRSRFRMPAMSRSEPLALSTERKGTRSSASR